MEKIWVQVTYKTEGFFTGEVLEVVESEDLYKSSCGRMLPKENCELI